MHEFWRKHYHWMNEDQWTCFEMLCDLFGGAHHVSGVVHPNRDDGIVINTSARNHFATFDYSHLTTAVLMAHERCIRFAIEPSKGGMLRLCFQKRHARDGNDMAHYHPDLKSAIDRYTQAQRQSSKGDSPTETSIPDIERMMDEYEKVFPRPRHIRRNPQFLGRGRYEPDNALLHPEAAEAAELMNQRWIGWFEGKKASGDIPDLRSTPENASQAS